MATLLYADPNKYSVPELREIRNQSRDHRMKERILCILWSLEEKMTAPEIAQYSRRHVISIRSWIKAYNEAGIEGLELKPGAGKPSHLTEEDENFIIELLRTNPEKHGFAGRIWDCQTLAAVFSEIHGKVIHKDVVWRMFTRRNYSYKRPKVYNPKEDVQKKRASKRNFSPWQQN